MAEKTYTNVSIEEALATVSDITLFGDANSWIVLCKASSQEEEWMKSTKVMPIEGVGVLVQVSTQNEDMIAEALEFIPGVKLDEVTNEDGTITRKLVKM